MVTSRQPEEEACQASRALEDWAESAAAEALAGPHLGDFSRLHLRSLSRTVPLFPLLCKEGQGEVEAFNYFPPRSRLDCFL